MPFDTGVVQPETMRPPTLTVQMRQVPAGGRLL